MKADYARFILKVKKSQTCWIWLGADNGKGYGQFWYNGGPGYAHRFSYQYHVDQIPEGYAVHHTCKNRMCVNPEHLQACSYQEHNKIEKASQTKCKNGHEFTTENTYITPENHRSCKQCRKINQRKFSNYQGGTANRDKTHCVHGHEFSPSNTYIRKDGARSCKTCTRARKRKYNEYV